MSGVNKVIIIGGLGQDPEVKYSASGNAIANLSVATSESWRDKMSGEKKEKTEWHRVVIFGKLAEVAGQYLRKGSKVYLEGKLQTRKWQDNNGQDKYTTEIVLDGFGSKMEMLSPAGGNQTQQTNAPQQNRAPQHSPHRQEDRFPNPTGNSEPVDFDDDLPFADPYHRASKIGHNF